jgi:hypothetical protein
MEDNTVHEAFTKIYNTIESSQEQHMEVCLEAIELFKTNYNDSSLYEQLKYHYKQKRLTYEQPPKSNSDTQDG